MSANIRFARDWHDKNALRALRKFGEDETLMDRIVQQVSHHAQHQ
jgi:hypothetical protein